MPINPSNKQQSLRVDADGRLLVSGSGGGGGGPAYTGTWASRPSAAAAGAGAEIVITDVGPTRSTWVSDGGDWHPLNGRVTLAMASGSNATPLAAITAVNGTASVFATPNIVVPAGLAFTGSKLIVTAFMRRAAQGAGPSAANGIIFWNSVNGAVSGSQAGALSLGTAVGTRGLVYGECYVASTSIYSTSYTVALGGTAAPGAPDSAINTSADSYVYFAASGIFETGAVINLIGYSVELVG